MLFLFLSRYYAVGLKRHRSKKIIYCFYVVSQRVSPRGTSSLQHQVRIQKGCLAPIKEISKKPPAGVDYAVSFSQYSTGES